MKKTIVLTFFALLALFSSNTFAVDQITVSPKVAQAQFTLLGDFPGGWDDEDVVNSGALGVSADGSVVVGYGTSDNGYEAFRRTEAGGMVSLGDLPGGAFESGANGVSADGSVVVGYGTSTPGPFEHEAFRWTQAGGMVGLGDLPGGNFYSEAHGVSANGSVVVGHSQSANGAQAFRWTETGGMVGLGDLPGGTFSSVATSVSADGSVVVGYSDSDNGIEAFRWTQASGMVGLGDLPGGSFSSSAHGVNADGSVVVGYSHSGNGGEAFRWTQASGMVGLGDLPGGGFFSRAYGVNADGSVVVGYGVGDNDNEAFRWTQAGGMVGLGELVGGVFESGANAVNADGSVVVGAVSDVFTGFDDTYLGEAFMARFGSGLGEAVPIPSLSIPGLVLLALAVLGLAWVKRRRFSLFILWMLVPLPLALLSVGPLAAEPFLLEVVLTETAPAPEAIVEGDMDFATGPLPVLAVGNPTHVAYLLPFRAKGAFLAWLQAHPDSARAKLERGLLLAYSSEIDRETALLALQAEPLIEAASISLETEFSMSPVPEEDDPPAPPTPVSDAKAVSGIPNWRAQLHLPQAWQRAGGWARIGVPDNGVDLGHPDLMAFDPGGQYLGGNLITADTLDLGRLGLGTNQGVSDCVFGPLSTCDSNLDEMEPVAINNGAPCDTTLAEPVPDGFMQPRHAGHGTHVLGLIGASHNNADTSQGACPHCAVQPMRSGFIECRLGLVYPNNNTSAAAAANVYLIDRGIQIISMSFTNNSLQSASSYCQVNPATALCLSLDYAEANGVLPVAASGNNRHRLGFPARDPRVIAVGGVSESLAFWDEAPGQEDVSCPFNTSSPPSAECGSNWTTLAGGPKQELVAPARQIDSTMYRGLNWITQIACGDEFLGTSYDGHGTCTGTSMATPIVAGIAGLVRSVNPLLLPGDPEVAVDADGVREVLTTTTDRAQLGLGWNNKLGYGLVDADAAVRAVLGTVEGQDVKNRATPMFGLINTFSGTDYAYSATPQGVQALLIQGYSTSGEPTPGYTALPETSWAAVHDPRASFYVMATEVKPQPELPDLIPLFLLESIRNWPLGCTPPTDLYDPPCIVDHRDVTLATEADLEIMVAGGYRYFGRQGFIFAPCGPEPDCIIPDGAQALYRRCNGGEDDCAVFLQGELGEMVTLGYSQTYPPASPSLLGYAFPNIDTDGDGLIDGMEHLIGTNATLADSDGDGLLDGQEYPQAGLQVSDPCQGPNLRCNADISFSNGFESF